MREVDGRAALVAVGGYGRRELAPASDLDVLLLFDGRRLPAGVTERLWYPIWDAKLKLGHAVRTVKDALRLATEDLDTATSLLSVRHLAGDPRLTSSLLDGARAQWRKRAKRWLVRLSAAAEERHAESGEVAFLLEPNLKEGRGGLRDVHTLGWVAAAHPVLADGDADALRAGYEVLLAARVELHRVSGRAGDVLALQDQDEVASRLGQADADALMTGISAAARTISWVSDEAWQRLRVATGLAGAGSSSGRDRALASGIREQHGVIHLDDAADPARDPTLLLRAATAAARTRQRIDRTSLDRLADETPPWPDPWPAGASDDLVALLLEGHDAIDVLESLDQRDLITRVLPEWEPVRARPSATPTTASPSTGTSGRRRPTPPTSPSACTGPTCSCSARCSTTWARATPVTTPRSGWCSWTASATAWACPRRTSRCSSPSSATTSCCRTWPPAAT